MYLGHSRNDGRLTDVCVCVLCCPIVFFVVVLFSKWELGICNSQQEHNVYIHYTHGRT
jgi:hypothetical protein